MAAHGRKFSFSRLVSNMVPNFARDDPNDVNLTPAQADALCKYQLNEPHPRYLSELSFLIAGITSSESVSKKIHKALLKHNLILAPPSTSPSPSSPPSSSPSTGKDETMTVNTAGVTKDFANQLAVISVHAQRKLVGMLFFWEEELVRLRLLDGEEREVRGAMGGGAGHGELEVRLRGVRMRKRLLPSERGEETANVTAGKGHELPAYT